MGLASHISLCAIYFLINHLYSYGIVSAQHNPHLEDPCSDLLDKFSLTTSLFIMCSLENSRPITFCQECVDKYLDTLESYKNMSKVEVNGTTCIDNFVNLDRLAIVERQYLSNINLWQEAKCPRCFAFENGTQTKNLSIIATKFKFYYSLYENCTQQHTGANVCANCMKEYVDLDTYYRSISNENERIGTCMDLVDKMNSSWTFWGAKCCSMRKHTEIGFILATVLVLVVTVLFYVLAQFFSKQKTASIIQQTRFPVFLSSTSSSINHQRLN